MEALPSLKVEKEASGETTVKDIQRVSWLIRMPHRAELMQSLARTKMSSTMLSSLSSLDVSNLSRKRRIQRNLLLMTRTRLSGEFNDR